MPIQLVSKDLAEVVEALKDDGSARAGDNRKFSRISVGGVVRLTPLRRAEAAGAPPTRTISALARDISFQGIGLLQGMPAAKGEHFVAHLPRANGRAPLVVICRVMHCRALADGIYAIGAEFAELASNAAAAGPNAGPAKADAIASEAERIRASIFS